MTINRPFFIAERCFSIGPFVLVTPEARTPTHRFNHAHGMLAALAVVGTLGVGAGCDATAHVGKDLGIGAGSGGARGAVDDAGATGGSSGMIEAGATGGSSGMITDGGVAPPVRALPSAHAPLTATSKLDLLFMIDDSALHGAIAAEDAHPPGQLHGRVEKPAGRPPRYPCGGGLIVAGCRRLRQCPGLRAE